MDLVFLMPPSSTWLFSLESGILSWKLFRKPMALYHYVPRSSCHPDSIFDTVPVGEFFRILRRCKSTTVACKEIEFTRSRFLNRGYDAVRLDHSISRAFRMLERRNSQISLTRADAKNVRKVFFVQKHSSSLNLRALRSAFSIIRPIMQAHGARPVLARSVQPNIFRKLYPINWGRS